ncbi:hypothetical protein ACFOWU_09015 [Epilithonimonas zeae]|uniref:Uncharacterized protein n=1 Tax=Epilithonimonas zeae TaxID=1416779 RepID=A0A1N6GJA5_9FLAO|nr:hypothetical protein [Epilithonimonas zeae]SIO07615.1 hypothetical protein SAMN05444409_1885 [Epilithonimonas zeae]
MNETLLVFLMIIVFIIGFSWSMIDLLNINKKLKSKNFKEKRKAYKDLKSDDGSLISDSIAIIINICRKIF